MGQKSSKPEVRVEVSQPAGPFKVDAITLGYPGAACLGRGWRRLARVTFPRRGWVTEGGVEVCVARGGLRLPLATLGRKEGSTPVRVKCSSRGVPVGVANLPLARLLALLGEAGEKGAPLLRFTLMGGDEAAPRGAAFTLWCNRWRCGEEEEGVYGAPSPGEEGYGGGSDCLEEEEGRGGTGDLVPGNSASAADDLTSVAPSQEAVPLPDPLSPAWHMEATWTVPGTNLGVPSWSDQDCDTVPEMDLGDPSSLAFLKLTMPEIFPTSSSKAILAVPKSDEGDTACSAQADEAVPDIDLGDPSSLAYLKLTVPEVFQENPSCSSKAILAIPKPDLKEPLPSAQALDTVPEAALQEPSPSAQAFDTVQEAVLQEPQKRALSAAPPMGRSAWLDVFLDAAAALNMVVAFLLLLYEFW